jgi:hypothetical protein
LEKGDLEIVQLVEPEFEYVTCEHADRGELLRERKAVMFYASSGRYAL